MVWNRANRAFKSVGGNTGSPTPKQPTQHKYWCFTLNNYQIEQIEHIEQVLKHESCWYVFQEEVGAEGTPHLQGTVCLKQRQRMTELKSLDPKIHWEPTKSVKASLVYCTKAETAVGKIYHHNINLPEQVEVVEPWGWALQVMTIVEAKPDSRTIHWFWEPDGGKGKTSLAKYLVVKCNALMLTGKSNDMYHMIAKFPNKRKLFIVDCPRSMQDYLNYGAIEQIKNGLIFSGKYEGAQLVFNAPHVIVFSNQEPDYDKMSLDRWNVVRIKDPTA
jgi:hypothetical protein